jgi:hypothetical protein
MIEKLFKRFGYEKPKSPPPLRCATIIVKQEGKPDCSSVNLCENDKMDITYDFTIIAHRNLNSDECYIYLGSDRIGIIDLNGLTNLNAKRIIQIEWKKDKEEII